MRKTLLLTLAVLSCCLLPVAALSQDLGDARTLLTEAVRPGVTLSVDKGCGAAYYYDETVNVTIRSQLAGYLVLYDFAADGTIQQIFPNAYSADSDIRGGETYTIPGNLLPFVFRVAPPEGTEVLFAVVTSGPCELVPDDVTDTRSAFPLITQSTEATVLGIVSALNAVPADVRVAAAVCYFTVAAKPKEEPAPPPTPTPTPNDSPTAKFTWSGPQSGTPRVGDTIRFDATESADSDGRTTDYAWDWESDGTYDATWATPVVSHAFATAGSYQVTLRVTDDDSATATTSQTITVTPVTTPNQPPTARFTWGGSQNGTPRVGDVIRFDAGQSADTDGRITAYTWDWESDGAYDSTGANSVVSHAFSTAGSYRVTVRVTDDDGATGTASQTIAVAPTSTSTPPSSEGKVYALLIAISDYPGTDNDLEGAPQNTIAAMRQAIGDWFDEVRYLSDGQATKAGILDGMNSFLGQAGPADTVYIQFAGHGHRVLDTNGDETDGYDETICPYDSVTAANEIVPGRLITDDELATALSTLRAKRAVLVLDSCYSGTMERGLAVTTLYDPTGTRDLGYDAGGMLDEPSGGTTRASGGSAQLWLQACASNELSKGVLLKDGRWVVLFGFAVAEAFADRVTDADQDGWISFQEAFAVARAFVSKWVHDNIEGEEQTPQIHDDIGQPVKVVDVGS
jgi:hypothetical protein